MPSDGEPLSQCLDCHAWYEPDEGHRCAARPASEQTTPSRAELIAEYMRPTDADTASLLRELAAFADGQGDHALRNRALLYSRALSQPAVETDAQEAEWSSAMPFEWSDPGSPLTELRMWYDHAVLKAEAARRTGKYPLLLADKDRAFAAMLNAALAATPPAPDAEREAVSYLRLCFDAVMEGRDGDGQFSRKIYELLDEMAAPAKGAL